MASLANLFTSPGKPLMQNARQALKKSISGMLHHPSITSAKEPTTPQEESAPSPTPSACSIPSSPAVLRTRGSIVSLSRLSVSSCSYTKKMWKLDHYYYYWILQASTNLTPYRPPAHTPTKHRIIQLWSETWGKTTAPSLTNLEIKRQEVQ